MLYLRLDDTSITLAAYTHQRSATSTTPTANVAFAHQLRNNTLPLEQQLQQLRASDERFLAPSAMQVLVVGATTLVPLSEFDEDKCEDIYRFCLFGEKGSAEPLRVFYDTLPAANAALLFALSSEQCRAIEGEFGEVYYVSALTATLRHLGNKLNPMHHRRVYVHSRQQATDIVIFDEQRILVLNTFSTNTASDAAYYTFGLMQSLGLPTATTPITVCGESGSSAAVVAELRRYAPQTGHLHARAEHHRHPVAEIEGIPFDLATQIILTQ